MKGSVVKIFSFYRSEAILLLLMVITILFSINENWVESFYSTGIYIGIGKFFRLCFGWIPFSVGDILYVLAGIFVIVKLVKFIKQLRRKQLNKTAWKRKLRKIITAIAIIYLVFQWSWGLNYHRLGSSYQLSIEPREYSEAELQQLIDTLNNRLYSLIPQITTADSLVWSNTTALKKESADCYKQAEKKYPFIRYQVVSIKKMLIGAVGGYGGFSGYLNPFTGEAQINGGMPDFLKPYVMCHEMGHQLGYAAEEEASMIGYLAAKGSSNPAVRYSVYQDLMSYASRELYHIDSNAYHGVIQNLPPLVKQHFKQARDYFNSYRNFVQKLSNIWYDMYLKANNQEKGLQSYNYVTAWLIAYAEKYGWEKI